MRKTTKSLICLPVLLAVVGGANAATINYSGVVSTDFAGVPLVVEDSAFGNPVVPAAANMPYACGWDIERIYFDRDLDNNTLQIGMARLSKKAASEIAGG